MSEQSNGYDFGPAQRLLQLLFEPDDLIELRPIETWTEQVQGRNLKRSRPLERRWVTRSSLDGALEWLAGLNRSESGNAFFGVCPRRDRTGKKTSIRFVRALWADIDGRTPDQVLQTIRANGLPEPSLVVNSGHGTHVYWLLADTFVITSKADLERIESVLIRLQRIVGGDATQDVCRLLRLPGFPNVKNGRNGQPPAPCTLVRCDVDSSVALEDLEATLPAAAAPREKSSAARPPKKVPRDIELMIRGLDTVPVGDRSEHDYAVLSALMKQSYDAERAWVVVQQHGKFRQAGRPYFDRTWQNAAKWHLRAPAADEDWPDPQPLPDPLPPVMSLDLALLPESVRPWIQDIAERVQCPPDYPAIAVMIAIAAVVGRKVGIRPKRHDDWLVVANLWGAAVGQPGVMKTPAIQEPLKVLKRLEIEAKKAHDAALEEFEARELVAEQRKQAGKSAVREALKQEGGDPLAVAKEALQGAVARPVRRRYLVNDSTVEKLGEILNENPNGVLGYRDELIGLLKSLDKDGQEGARSFYLEAWNGSTRYTYDRIGRGTVDIEAAIVSLIGSIQPGPLRGYLAGALQDGESADGLIQRFQLAVYPDISKGWRNVDRWPDSAAKLQAYDVIVSLDQLRAGTVGAVLDDQDEDEIPHLRFDDAAQDRFDAWRSELEHRLRSGEEHAAIEAHLAKYRSLIPSLALLCHLADGGTGAVGIGSLERAIAWGRYLESHARRIFAVAIAPDTAEGLALAKKLLSGVLADEFALRDVYRKGWVGLGTKEEAQRGVELLCDLDWLSEVQERTAGRTRTYYRINPKVPVKPKRGTAKTDRSPSDDAARPLLSVLSPPAEGKYACADLAGSDAGELNDAFNTQHGGDHG